MIKKTLLVLAVLFTGFYNDSAAQSWSLNGNAGTNASSNFIGTTDAINFKIRTNNVTRIFVHNNASVAIGNSAPRYPFDVKVGSINTDSLYRIGGNRARYDIGVKPFFHHYEGHVKLLHARLRKRVYVQVNGDLGI